MPSFKTAGKSKEDLSLVAQLAGLLTATETREMTRTQLVRFLEKENEKVERAEHPVPATEPETVRVRKPRARVVRDSVDSSIVSTGQGTGTDLSGSELPGVVLPQSDRSGSDRAGSAAAIVAVEPVIIELPMETTVRRTPGRKKKSPVIAAQADATIGQPALILSEPVSAEPAADQKKTVRRISRASIRSGETVPTVSLVEPAETSNPATLTTAITEQIIVDSIQLPVSEPTRQAADVSILQPADAAIQQAAEVSIQQPADAAIQQPADAAIQLPADETQDKLNTEATVPEAIVPPVPAPVKRGPGRRKAAPAAEPEPAVNEPVKVKKKPGRKPGSGRKQKSEAVDSQTVLPVASEPSVHTGPIQAPERTTRRSPGRKPRREAIDLEVAAGQATLSDQLPSKAEEAEKPDGLARPAEMVKPVGLPDASELSPEAAGAADEQSRTTANEPLLTAADQQNMRTEQDARNLSQARSEMNRHGIAPQNMRPRSGFQRTRPLTPGQAGPEIRRDPDRTRPVQPVDPRGGINDTERMRREPRMPGAAPGVTGTSGRLSGSVSDHKLISEPSGRSLDIQSGLTGQDRADEPAEPTAATAVRTADPAGRQDGELVHERRTIAETGEPQGGVLEIMPDGYGFLRKDNYLQGNKDIYVPPQYIRRFGLRQGDYITGPVRLQRETDRYQALLYIKDVNGQSPEKMLHRPHFDRLTPIYPDERFVLETVRNELSTRIIDLVAPIGKGQRGMIVSPPKAGKTILLQKIANAISVNNPDTKLIVLLIDERPEEVTDMQRSIKGEVVYSTFDKTPENHTKVVELVLERAMRLVELKQDVIILLDSMTRLARAYNLTINPTGRTLSGGLDPGALYGPKRFFGAARNIENGGSLTIIATSLIETGSRMDEVIFEEFKGTGNMEVYLDRKLSEKRIFPAIDINKSGTRREELLMNNKELDAVWTIRKAFSQLDTSAVTEAIINLLLKTKNNEHFISSVNVSFNDKNVFDAMRGVRPGTQGAQPGTAGSGERTNQGSNPGGYGYGGSYNNTGYGSNYRRTGANDDD